MLKVGTAICGQLLVMVAKAIETAIIILLNILFALRMPYVQA